MIVSKFEFTVGEAGAAAFFTTVAAVGFLAAAAGMGAGGGAAGAGIAAGAGVAAGAGAAAGLAAAAGAGATPVTSTYEKIQSCIMCYLYHA